MEHIICSVGDIIYTKSGLTDNHILSLKNVIQKADTRLFNLENVLSDKPIYGSSFCGGTWLLADENTKEEALKKLGIEPDYKFTKLY